MGLVDARVPQRHRDRIMAMFDLAKAPLLGSDRFDFGDATILRRLREAGLQFADEREFWRLPPTDALFLQRKVGGTYLLAARLKARVDVKGLAARYVQTRPDAAEVAPRPAEDTEPNGS
jgi:hypothetical protein